jgi:hypothetical protein
MNVSENCTALVFGVYSEDACSTKTFYHLADYGVVTQNHHINRILELRIIEFCLQPSCGNIIEVIAQLW